MGRAYLAYGAAGSVLVLGLVAALLLGSNAVAVARVLDDRFRGYEAQTYTDLDTFGPWMVNFAGYGEVTTRRGTLALAPKAAADPATTHAALVTSQQSYSHTCQVSRFVYRTTAQLRTGSAPNPWEVGWVVWDYVDNQHFSYGIVKPNGLELGQRHPSYPGGQRFLHTAAEPSAGLGDKVRFKVKRVVKAKGHTVSVVRVNGQKLAKLRDDLHPYTHGSVGVYTEDAVMRVKRVSVRDCS